MSISRNLVIIVTLLILLTGFFIALTAQTTYRYGSSAQEAPVLTLTQESISIVQLASDQLPSCVKTLTYLPKSAVSTCFVELECTEEPSAQPEDVSCEATSELGLRCAYPDESCIELMNLAAFAAKACGC